MKRTLTRHYLMTTLLMGVGVPAQAAVISDFRSIPLSSFGDNDVACTTGGSPVGPASCSTSGNGGTSFYLSPFDTNLGTLTSAVLHYSYRLDGNFITRTPVVAGEGRFSTSARIDRGGSTIASASTGTRTFLSSTLQNEGALGQRIDPYSLAIDGAVNLDITRVTYDATTAPTANLSYLLIGTVFSISAGINSSPTCAFGDDICGATNRVTAVKSLRDFGPFGAVVDDAFIGVTYTYDLPAPPTTGNVPLPPALWLVGAGMVAVGRRSIRSESSSGRR